MLPELNRRFEGVVARQAKFLRDIGSLAPDQLDFHPKEGAWSLCELAQHLALVEEKTTKVLTQRRVTGIAHRRVLDVLVRAPALDLYFLFGGRAKVPVKGVVPVSGVPLADTITRWAAARAQLTLYLEEVDAATCRTIVYRHPIAGYMDIGATLRFLTQHHDHHMRQAKRITRAPGFPRAS
jgi:hypothetical protein